MSTKEQLEKTTRICLALLERMEEVEEVIKPNPDSPQWRWEGDGEPLCDIQNFPPLLIEQYLQ